LLAPAHPQIFAYERQLGHEKLTVIANFSKDAAVINLGKAIRGRDPFTGDVTRVPAQLDMKPYDVLVVEEV
jgi:glycosidase